MWEGEISDCFWRSLWVYGSQVRNISQLATVTTEKEGETQMVVEINRIKGKNIMLLKQDINGGNLNGYPPEDQIFPSKYGSTCYLEFYCCHEWVNISNNFPQIPPDRVLGGGGMVEVYVLAEDPALECYILAYIFSER